MTIRNLSSEEINSLFPIRNLPDSSKKRLQETIQTEEVSANGIIFSAGSSDEKQIYILEGKLQLSSARANERVIEGGQVEARFPIDNNTPRQATAVALEPLTILSIKRSFLDELVNETSPAGTGDNILDENDEALLYNQLYFEVTQEMQADNLELPSIPETAIKVRSVIADSQASSEKTAQVIQQDPAIAVQLIKVANSPLFRGRDKIEALPAAITRLGLKAVGNLATSFTMRMIFNAKTKDVKERIASLWLHSRDVASTCAVLAKKLKGFDADKAMLAGLVHDIGAIPILTHADKHPSLMENPQEVENTLSKLTPIISKMILEKWNFTEDFSELALNAENWSYEPEQISHYTDLIIVAQLLCFKNTPLHERYPEAESTLAYQRLTKLLKDPADSLDIMENSQEELAGMKQLFN